MVWPGPAARLAALRFGGCGLTDDTWTKAPYITEKAATAEPTPHPDVEQVLGEG